MSELSGKHALVTGGGRGIGRAIALAFARAGADVAVMGRTRAEVEATATEIAASGRRALAVVGDVSDAASVRRAVDTVHARLGRIDVLVNNAGIQGPIGPLAEAPVDAWIETVMVNLVGVFLVTRAVVPDMIRAGGGKIINLSGGGATSPRPNFSAYAASKTAVVRLTETLAAELADAGIAVNAIAPGAVNTRMTRELLAAGDRAGARERADAERRLADGGTDPARVAELAVFLASGESDGLSGRLLSVVWDDWKSLQGRIAAVMASDVFTLRRVAPEASRP